MIECGLILTSRIKSSRLENKVLQKINGKPAIEILLDRLINNKYPVILAIPENSDNDVLAEIAEQKGIEVYRGYDESPLHRLTYCAIENDFKNVVRVTHDDILIDQIVLMNQIKMHIRGNKDYTFCRKIPDGCAAEVIRTDILKEVVDLVGDKPVEFISYYIKNKYDTFEYYPDKEFQYPFRLTMDYEEDLMLLRLIFASLAEPIGTLDIINFLKRHPYFLNINRLPAITVYTCNYNTSDYIIDAMQSVLNQTFQDYEYIVIDDCSTDNSMNIITEYYAKLKRPDQEKIKILRNDKNIGLPACCNKVLEMARGKNIIRLDSDDTMNSDALQNMFDEMKLNQAQAVITAYNNTDENLNIIDTINKNMWHPGCALISTWAANELKYQENLEFMEGKDFYERFRQKYKWSFYDKPMWNYRKRPGQKTQQKEHPLNKGE